MSSSSSSVRGAIFLDSLPPDIIRLIIPLGPSRNMRLINKEWNRLALEYLKEKRVIECVQVRPGDDSDKEVKIALTISKQDTGYFDVNHWNGSESDEDFLGKSVVAVSSSYNIQNIFLDHFGGSKILALTFCICFSWFAIPVGVVAYSYFIVITLLNLLIVKLAGRFHSLRNTAIRFTRYNCINDRARIKRRQTNPGTKAKRQRYQLIKLLELSARIKTLKVHDVDMLAFDAFCHCLGTVQIGRLEISLKNYGILNLNFGMHWQIFEEEIRQLVKIHGLSNGVMINGNEITM